MTVEGEELAAELENLWLVGKWHLPEVAAVYAESSNTVAGTASSDAAAYEREVDWPFNVLSDATTMGQVYPEWNTARAAIQEVLARTCDNVSDAAEAVCMIVNAYAETDHVAAEKLHDFVDAIEKSGTLPSDVHVPEPTHTPMPPQPWWEEARDRLREEITDDK